MPRSILKKPFVPLESQPSAPSSERNTREIALYHANLIKQRKEVEAQILTATEALLEFPTSTNADPAKPSIEDVVFIKDSLRSFQPSDYDTLIEERNINTLCGILPIRGKGTDTLKFVERKSLEKWCSDICGKRALFIKAQLNEEPAWTRRPGIDGGVVLLHDNNGRQGAYDEESLINELKNLNVSLGEEHITEKIKALDDERGDGNKFGGSFGSLEVREKSIVSMRHPPSHDPSHIMHKSIEGYQPHFGSNEKGTKTSDDEAENIIAII
ncbi:MAG: hypothetical protein Q9163_005011 [Psora crenata]